MENASLSSQVWWRNGYVWLVIGGPLVVVIAAIATAIIAIRMPDPVIDEDYYRKGLEINKTLDAQRQQMLPAEVARNHAATLTQPAPMKTP
ncbi:MAG: hypothetical protein RLY90_155 [Pseudomonadota bacterium]|jgi:hypothetical protein